jgi:hypothetical protein
MTTRRSVALAAFALTLSIGQLQAQAGEPTAAPMPPSQPAQPPAPRVAQLKVTSLKPGLMARHQLTLRGFTQQKPVGGYQWKFEPSVRLPAAGEKKGFVQIKATGTADGSAPLVKGMPPSDFIVEEKIEVPDLKDKHGDFDVEVVDGAGAVIFQTTIHT